MLTDQKSILLYESLLKSLINTALPFSKKKMKAVAELKLSNMTRHKNYALLRSDHGTAILLVRSRYSIALVFTQ